MFNFNLEDIFDEYFNQKDIYVTMKITKQQAKSGMFMPVEIKRKVISEDKGYIVEKTVETINIPKNVKHNTFIKLNGKGNYYSNEENGNLYVEIKVFGIK